MRVGYPSSVARPSAPPDRTNAGAAADDVEDVFDGILGNFSDRRWGDLVDLRHYGPHIQADVAPDANRWLLSYDVNSAALSGRLGDASLYWPGYLRIQAP